MIDTPAMEPERPSPGNLIALALLRSALTLILLLCLETALRAVTGTARFPDLLTWSAEGLARAGRLLPLTVPLAFVHLVLTAAEISSPAGARLVARGTQWLHALCNTAVALRMLVAYLLTAAALIPWVRKEYQLIYPVAASYAVLVVPLVSALQLWWLAHRQRSAPASLLGCSIWLALILVLSFGAVPWIGLSQLGAAGALLATIPFARWLPIQRFSVRPLLLAVLALTIAGVAIDHRDPALRRFGAITTPFSALALDGYRKLADLDGDGSSHWWGLDCDGFDPNRGPLLADLPDDGVDQNCTGKDGSLQESLTRFSPGSPRKQAEPEPGDSPKPDIFLISMDALRADTFADRAVLPRLNQWADGCFRFSNARSNANFTGEALVSLHTGMFPRHILTDDYRWGFDLAAPAQGKVSTPPTLAAVLSLRGYETVVAFPPFHVANFQFLTGYQGGGTLPSMDDASFPPFEVTLDHIAQYRAQIPPGRPVHLRAHFMDLHTPYRGGDGYAGYLRTAAALDDALAHFLSALPAEAIVAFTADHGEAFGEHGAFNHGHQLFDEELRVPLVLCAPPRFRLGPPRAVSAPVGLVDVMPTLLDLAGIQSQYPHHGQSLVPHLRHGTPLPRPWHFAEDWLEDRHTAAVVLGCHKWLVDDEAGWEALFDVCADPLERRDLTREEPAKAQELRTLFGDVLDQEIDAFRSWRIGSRPILH